MARCSVVLVDGTFWTNDEMQRLGLSQGGAGHGPSAAKRRRRHARSAGAPARRRAQGAHPHQQHQPHPERGLARAPSWPRRAWSWPSMAWKLNSDSGQGQPTMDIATSPAPTQAFPGARRSSKRQLRDKGAAYHIHHPFNCAHERRRLHRGRAALLGSESLLLPDLHTAQGRRHPGQHARSRAPPPVGGAHPRP